MVGGYRNNGVLVIISCFTNYLRYEKSGVKEPICAPKANYTPKMERGSLQIVLAQSIGNLAIKLPERRPQ